MATEQDGRSAAAGKVCGYEYTVKRGDSFYLIAHRLGVPLRDLLDANSDVNPARLMVGDVLCIPMEEDDKPQEQQSTPLPETEEQRPAAPEEDEAEDWESEDTPEALETPATEATQPAQACARRHVMRQGETAADIQIEAGLNLRTLAAANPGRDLETLKAGDEVCVPQENVPCPVAATYTLRTDDTLESVALRENLSVGALLRLNPCLAPGDFVAGVSVVVG